MKLFLTLILILGGFSAVFAQSEAARKIYETERAFERAVAERGYNQGFIEFLTDDAVMFLPEIRNAKEFYQSQPASLASLTWNPLFIDVSSNGALAYSVGSGVYRPQGKSDPNAFYSHYVSVWRREPDAGYKVVFDAGVSHEKPARVETDWQSPAASEEANEKKISAADASTVFFETAEKQSLAKAYQAFLAADARVLRTGKMPLTDKKRALAEIKKDKSAIKFAKRSVFTSAANLAYITNSYSRLDKQGKETERGNFVQIWKFRDGKWQIVCDLFQPLSS